MDMLDHNSNLSQLNEEESAEVLSLKEWKLVNSQMMIGENITAHKNLYKSDIMKHYWMPSAATYMP